jgi:hypothetical protein
MYIVDSLPATLLVPIVSGNARINEAFFFELTLFFYTDIWETFEACVPNQERQEQKN